MVRGLLPVMLIGFDFLKKSNSVATSAAIVAFFAFGLGILATITTEETHGKDLEFVE
jgi:hypothetical protein